MCIRVAKPETGLDVIGLGWEQAREPTVYVGQLVIIEACRRAVAVGGTCQSDLVAKDRVVGCDVVDLRPVAVGVG
jgi:hypothetical protein